MIIKQTRNKRELILEAGAKIFSQKGYHNAKMEEIAVAAGIGKGTIYEYFSSKLQLFQEIIDQSLQHYSSIIKPDDMSRMTVERRIETIIRGHFIFCQQNKEMSRMLFWDAEVIDEELKNWLYQKRSEKESVLQGIIEEGIRRRELRMVDARLVTLMISGILGQIWLPIVLESWDPDADASAKQIIDLIMDGLKECQSKVE